MTTNELIDLYITHIKANYPDIQPGPDYKSLSRVLWVLYQMKETVRRENGVVVKGSAEKFNRQLGFVQGVLWWATNDFTTEDFDRHVEGLTYA